MNNIETELQRYRFFPASEEMRNRILRASRQEWIFSEEEIDWISCFRPLLPGFVGCFVFLTVVLSIQAQTLSDLKRQSTLPTPCQFFLSSLDPILDSESITNPQPIKTLTR